MSIRRDDCRVPGHVHHVLDRQRNERESEKEREGVRERRRMRGWVGGREGGRETGKGRERKSVRVCAR